MTTPMRLLERAKPRPAPTDMASPEGRPRLPPRRVQLSWAGKKQAFGEGSPGEARDAGAAAVVEHIGAAGEGSLLHGDNLAALSALCRTHEGAVSLVYMDPPFFTNRVHEARLRKTGETRRNDERAREAAFDDRWDDQAAYLEALAPRILLARRLLASHGSLVVHVDPKTSHYVKVLCDEIFGAECFASEIVWRYRRWPSKTPNFQRVHDVLLRYRKDAKAKPRWNQPYEPLAASTLATWGTTKQRAVFDGGRRARSTSTDEPTLGVPMGDVWDIGVIAPVSKERTGYPSQKPLTLLKRLITALSDEGDVVLDPYAGSGTTLVASFEEKRRFIGIDQSDVAITTSLSRLESAGVTMARRTWAPGVGSPLRAAGVRA